MRLTWQLVVFIAALMCVGACAPKTASKTAVNPQPAAAGAAGVVGLEDLPEGPGRQILLTACTQCHGLREVTKFRGFYVRAQWRDVVVTMVDYGAAVDQKQIDVLTDYLTAQLGKK